MFERFPDDGKLVAGFKTLINKYITRTEKSYGVKSKAPLPYPTAEDVAEAISEDLDKRSHQQDLVDVLNNLRIQGVNKDQEVVRVLENARILCEGAKGMPSGRDEPRFTI